jgi:hypothetical protein
MQADFVQSRQAGFVRIAFIISQISPLVNLFKHENPLFALKYDTLF